MVVDEYARSGAVRYTAASNGHQCSDDPKALQPLEDQRGHRTVTAHKNPAFAELRWRRG